MSDPSLADRRPTLDLAVVLGHSEFPKSCRIIGLNDAKPQKRGQQAANHAYMYVAYRVSWKDYFHICACGHAGQGSESKTWLWHLTTRQMYLQWYMYQPERLEPAWCTFYCRFIETYKIIKTPDEETWWPDKCISLWEEERILLLFMASCQAHCNARRHSSNVRRAI